jgi:hypothetical protein
VKFILQLFYFLVPLLVFTGCKNTGGIIQGAILGERTTLSTGSLSISIIEGNSHSILVVLDKALPYDTTIDWTLDAPAGQFTATSGIITITKGTQSGLLQLDTINNGLLDGTRHSTLNLSGSSLVFENSTNVSVTVYDDDIDPTISIANVSLSEGNSGSSNATFTVTAAAASDADITVNYATSNGTATAGSDYTAASGTATITAGSTTTTFNVAISGDGTYEASETFTVTLSSGSGYTASGSTLSATGTITNDDYQSQTWTFATPSDYSYSTNYIDLSSGNRAELKTVNTTFNDSTTFGTGHAGTTYSSGLTLDATASAVTSHSASWTPKYSYISAYWKMDGDWVDAIGGNTPTPSGSPTFGVARVGSNSGSFASASSQYVDIADNDSLDGSAQMSFSFWVNPATLDGTARGVISKRVIGDDNEAYAFFFYTSNAMYFDIEGTGQRFSTSTLFNTNTWWHVGVVYDGSLTAAQRVKVYVNGVLDVTATESSTSIGNRTSTLRLGHLHSSGYLNGRLDDFAIWKGAALSAGDMSIIYHRQKQKYAGSYDSPVINMGATGATWTSLTSTATLPYMKNIPNTSELASYASAANNLATSQAAYWSFEEKALNAGPSSTDFADTSSIGTHHGTEAGGVVPGIVGKIGSAALFDGLDDSIAVGTVADYSAGYTTSAWFKTKGANTANAVQEILSQRSSVSNYDMQMYTNNSRNRLTCYFENNSTVVTSNWILGAGTLDGVWHHGACVFDPVAKTLTTYLDGVANTPVATGTTVPPTGGTAYIGSNAGTAGFFNGRIDELAVWTRVFSTAEVIEIYRRGANRVKYQVRSCIDSSCNCASYSTTPAGSATDCDGDGTLNAADFIDANAAGWLGPDGTGATYFSEVQNNASVDSSGNPTGAVGTGGLSLDWSGSFFTAAARPSTNQFFQFRAYLESEDENNLCTTACFPKVTSVVVGPTGRYWGGSPTIENVTGVTYTQLQTMSRSENNTCTTYQISTDGTNWKYWNGSAWAAATTQSNVISDVTAHVSALAAGTFYYKAFLATNAAFTQSCQLSSVGITYTP